MVLVLDFESFDQHYDRAAAFVGNSTRTRTIELISPSDAGRICNKLATQTANIIDNHSNYGG
jgi:hypothetical protein